MCTVVTHSWQVVMGESHSPFGLPPVLTGRECESSEAGATTPSIYIIALLVFHLNTGCASASVECEELAMEMCWYAPVGIGDM